MTFEQLEKRLLKNNKFREIAAKSEPEYQLIRSKIAARIDKSLIHSGFNVNYPNSSHKQLFRAILAAKNERELAAFLRDLLTISEIDAASERWEMARLLWTTNLSYKEIAKRVGGSTTTVTRVAQWLEHGMGGYQKILERIYGEKSRSGNR